MILCVAVLQAIRETWWSSNNNNNTADLVFVIGGEWKDIEEEVRIHSDILWLSSLNESDKFSDTLKTASFLQAVSGLSNHRHVVKAMDHSYIHISGIHSRLIEMERNHTIAMWGSFCGTGMRPGLVHLSDQEYDDYFLPEYCKGKAYVLSSDFVNCAVLQIPNTTLLSQDDAYIGLLGERCGLSREDFRGDLVMEWEDHMPVLRHDHFTAESMHKYHKLQILNHSQAWMKGGA